MKTWQRVLIVIVVGGLLGGAGSGYYLWYGRGKPTSPLSGSTVSIETPTPTPQELITWTDPAGFSFQYPKELSLNKHDEDNQNYAHLEFTMKDHPGNLIVWAKDTNSTDVAKWVKSEKRFLNANSLDTTLGGKPGKKIMVSTPSAMLITGTIDEGIVFTIEST